MYMEMSTLGAKLLQYDHVKIQTHLHANKPTCVYMCTGKHRGTGTRSCARARTHTDTHTHTHLGATALGTRRPCRLRLIPPAVPVLVLAGPGLVDVGDLPAQVLKGVVHWVGAEGLW